MSRTPSLARDAALHRMRRINRWLIAGAVLGAGVLTDVAAQAFPGRTIKRTASSSSGTRALPAKAKSAGRRRTRHRAVHHALTPPAQAPKAAPQVVEPVPGATSAPAPTQSAPAQSAPTQSAPAQSAPAAPVQSAPAPAPVQAAPAPAPVVSGGS
ncbi:MAG TPA: hypothetical protein VG388_14350 [Solirubrobacteraceae bacterium]|nr:hypothetical protein [Solirubrobacteraceae bacterium]